MDRGILEGRADTEIVEDTMDTGTVEDNTSVEESENEMKVNRLRTFVALVTLEVLEKTGAVECFEELKWVKHTKRLVNKTVEGLPAGIVLDVSPKKVATAAITELQEKLGEKLQVLLLVEDQACASA
ncbi:Hypothetical protein SMAX5B_011257 [Scophthalmus maximus]|uniref:Uncharacterized protein n=1 Tax=Scophthalmus maximus TaxID=52904 RepID=A0A2U9BHR3_SCOMX|nr:Hypothetical protein SMAX5B_011257 [Scophthalmus maximus]